MKSVSYTYLLLLMVTSMVSSTLEWTQSDVSPEMYQPANVDHSVWPGYVTKTIIGKITLVFENIFSKYATTVYIKICMLCTQTNRSLLHCSAVCSKNKATCNAVSFDDSGRETICQLSNIHQWRLTSEGKAIFIKKDAIGNFMKCTK